MRKERSSTHGYFLPYARQLHNSHGKGYQSMQGREDQYFALSYIYSDSMSACIATSSIAPLPTVLTSSTVVIERAAHLSSRSKPYFHHRESPTKPSTARNGIPCSQTRSDPACLPRDWPPCWEHHMSCCGDGSRRTYTLHTLLACRPYTGARKSS